MTSFFAVHDPGRSGGSWFVYLCNVHPARMRVLGELYLPSELDFAWPCPISEFEKHGIEFLKSQHTQGVAAAGIVKCFWAATEKFIRANDGRIIQLIRNPMEVLGSNMGKKPGVDVRFLRRKAKDANDVFLAHVLYYQGMYQGLWDQRADRPIVRLEDLNRSCGGNGLLLQGVMEWTTQTPWPAGYIKHIRQYYLPGNHYALQAIKDQQGVVTDIRSWEYQYEDWRMTWQDDPRPGEYWESWGEGSREVFVRELGPICALLGYNCNDNPGSTDLDWALQGQYAWDDGSLVPLPYTGATTIRGAYPRDTANLPRWRPDAD